MEKNIQIARLEKKLEVYGTLTTLLQSFYEKAHRKKLYEDSTNQIDNNNSHSLEVPYDANKLDEIFEKSRYLLSDELIGKYLEYIHQDTYLSIYEKRNKGGGLILCNLKEMQSAAEQEFTYLNSRYQKLLDISE